MLVHPHAGFSTWNQTKRERVLHSADLKPWCLIAPPLRPRPSRVKVLWLHLSQVKTWLRPRPSRVKAHRNGHDPSRVKAHRNGHGPRCWGLQRCFDTVTFPAFHHDMPFQCDVPSCIACRPSQSNCGMPFRFYRIPSSACSLSLNALRCMTAQLEPE